MSHEVYFSEEFRKFSEEMTTIAASRGEVEKHVKELLKEIKSFDEQAKAAETVWLQFVSEREHKNK